MFESEAEEKGQEPFVNGKPLGRKQTVLAELVARALAKLSYTWLSCGHQPQAVRHAPPTPGKGGARGYGAAAAMHVHGRGLEKP